jgi:hypothetical protein
MANTRATCPYYLAMNGIASGDGKCSHGDCEVGGYPLCMELGPIDNGPRDGRRATFRTDPDGAILDAQDNSGPLGIFAGGDIVAFAATHDTDGQATRAKVSADLDIPLAELEVLGVCPRHPYRSAVDCTECVPVGG